MPKKGLITEAKTWLTDKTYRPILFKIADNTKINPWLLFAILFPLSFFIIRIPGINLTNSLGISFMIPYMLHFSSKPKQYLEKLRPSFEITEEDYEKLKNQVGHYHFLRFIAVSLLAPLLVIIVNMKTGNESFSIHGQFSFLGIGLAKWYAILTGMLILQMNYVTISEAYRFNIIEDNYARVDLLDIHKLDGFSYLAISAGMSLIGIYTVIPFSLYYEPELYASLIVSLSISLPILLLILFFPIFRVYRDINSALNNEKKLIQKAFLGDKQSMKALAISQSQPDLQTIDLIQYRNYIKSISPLPITQNSVIKFLSSLILLLASWFVPVLFS